MTTSPSSSSTSPTVKMPITINTRGAPLEAYARFLEIVCFCNNYINEHEAQNQQSLPPLVQAVQKMRNGMVHGYFKVMTEDLNTMPSPQDLERQFLYLHVRGYDTGGDPRFAYKSFQKRWQEKVAVSSDPMAACLKDYLQDISALLHKCVQSIKGGEKKTLVCCIGLLIEANQQLEAHSQCVQQTHPISEIFPRVAETMRKIGIDLSLRNSIFHYDDSEGLLEDPAIKKMLRDVSKQTFEQAILAIDGLICQANGCFISASTTTSVSTTTPSNTSNLISTSTTAHTLALATMASRGGGSSSKPNVNFAADLATLRRKKAEENSRKRNLQSETTCPPSSLLESGHVEKQHKIERAPIESPVSTTTTSTMQNWQTTATLPSGTQNTANSITSPSSSSRLS